MAEYEYDGDLEDARGAVGVGQAPADGGEEEEEGQEVRKGGIRPVPCVLCLLLRRVSSGRRATASVRGSISTGTPSWAI
jgi:hypothetical protein